MFRVAIIGSGAVGQSLAKGFVSRGHETRIATRTPDEPKLKEFLVANPKIVAGKNDEVVKWADLIVFAVKWSGAQSAIAASGVENFAGKIVIDVTNPLRSDGVFGLEVGFNNSGGELVQSWIPTAKVVKAFNSVGHAHMIDPKFTEGTPTMFICGNDDFAKTSVTAIVKSFGWDCVDIGDITGSRTLEPLCILWCTYGFRTGTWNHAFKLITK